MRRRNQRGTGYSLVGLQPEIGQAVEILSDALASQGVEFDSDSLFLKIQDSVQSVANPGTALAPVSTDYSYLHASENVPPYCVAGDLLNVGYEHYKLGDKENMKKGIAKIIEAMEYEDFADITAGLLEMNRRSVQASEEDEDTDTVDEDIDETDEDEDDSEDLSDDDIDSLLDEDIEADDDITDEDGDETEEDEDENKPVDKKPEDKPVEKTSSTDNKPMGDESKITASIANRSIANKLSMSGDKSSRDKATNFLKKASNRAA